ncbi:hypothetical protein M231_03791 [Tremella mesenterica]|uniref:Uncharacterized protein n=1 Tax=Tremella mesenterica TaxID=5217 RepID=A0A4Q1BMB5_TREME|nr:hypothetical protein M231_03791 [Tremella mesenterica]
MLFGIPGKDEGVSTITTPTEQLTPPLDTASILPAVHKFEELRKREKAEDLAQYRKNNPLETQCSSSTLRPVKRSATRKMSQGTSVNLSSSKGKHRPSSKGKRKCEPVRASVQTSCPSEGLSNNASDPEEPYIENFAWSSSPVEEHVQE